MSTHLRRKSGGRRGRHKEHQQYDGFKQPIPALKSGPYGDCQWYPQLGQYVKPTAEQVRQQVLRGNFTAQQMDELSNAA